MKPLTPLEIVDLLSEINNIVINHDRITFQEERLWVVSIYMTILSELSSKSLFGLQTFFFEDFDVKLDFFLQNLIKCSSVGPFCKELETIPLDFREICLHKFSSLQYILEKNTFQSIFTSKEKKERSFSLSWHFQRKIWFVNEQGSFGKALKEFSCYNDVISFIRSLKEEGE